MRKESFKEVFGLKNPVYDLARIIDISCVKSADSQTDIDRMAELARKYHFVCAFALPGFTRGLVEKLKGSDTVVGGVVGFPSGCGTTAGKVFEARELIAMGCDELDMVINIGRLKSGNFTAVYDDIAAVVDAAQGRPVKTILEVTLLTESEIVAGCEAAVRAGAAFVKTGTGWMPQPTTVSHIRLMKTVIGDRAKIKAAGGVRNLQTLFEMQAAGCDRFGLGMRHAVSILREAGAE